MHKMKLCGRGELWLYSFHIQHYIKMIMFTPKYRFTPVEKTSIPIQQKGE